jgi:hypothetical protein
MLWLDKTRIDEDSSAVVAEGLYGLTRIATPEGWARAAELSPGDPVISFDSPPRRVVSVTRHRLDGTAPQAAWPLLVPPDVLGNAEAEVILPEQGVMIDSDLAERLFGEPFVTVPASALEGWRGIARTPPPSQVVVRLAFELPTLVYAARDMILACPGLPMLTATMGSALNAAPPLGPQAARHLVGCMIAADRDEAARLFV